VHDVYEKMNKQINKFAITVFFNANTSFISYGGRVTSTAASFPSP